MQNTAGALVCSCYSLRPARPPCALRKTLCKIIFSKSDCKVRFLQKSLQFALFGSGSFISSSSLASFGQSLATFCSYSLDTFLGANHSNLTLLLCAPFKRTPAVFAKTCLSQALPAYARLRGLPASQEASKPHSAHPGLHADEAVKLLHFAFLFLFCRSGFASYMLDCFTAL